MPHELESFVVEQVFDIAACAGEEIVDADHVRAFVHQSVAQVRSEEAGAAGYQDARFEMHTFAFLKAAGCRAMFRRRPAAKRVLDRPTQAR